MTNAFRFDKTVPTNSNEFFGILLDWSKNGWLSTIEYFDPAFSGQPWRSTNLALLDPCFPDLIKTKIEEMRNENAACRLRLTAVDPNDHNFRAKSSYEII